MEGHNRSWVGTALVGMVAGVIGTMLTAGLFIFVFLPDGFNVNSNTNSKDESSNTKTVIEIKGYEEIVVPIAKKVRPSIVGIRATNTSSNAFESLTAEATGVIISSDGYIVTNQHVIADLLDEQGKILKAASIEVFVEENSKSFKAQIIGFDSITDIALLKISTKGLSPAIFGDSDKLVVGDFVIAIGSPGGLKYMGSVSQGIISGINREVEFDDGTVMQLLQTDAAVNPGNSGGALVNSKGEVIGINNAGLEKSTFEGINFAIPSNIVMTISDDLKKSGFVNGRTWLGILAYGQNEYSGLQELYGFPNGILIRSVDPKGPASLAGIEKSDIIIEADNTVMNSTADLRRILNTKKPGDKIQILIYRLLTDEKIEKSVILLEKTP